MLVLIPYSYLFSFLPVKQRTRRLGVNQCVCIYLQKIPKRFSGTYFRSKRHKGQSYEPFGPCTSCVRVGSAFLAFWFSVGLRQGCTLSPLLLVIFIDLKSRNSHSLDNVPCQGISVVRRGSFPLCFVAISIVKWLACKLASGLGSLQEKDGLQQRLQ